KEQPKRAGSIFERSTFPSAIASRAAQTAISMVGAIILRLLRRSFSSLGMKLTALKPGSSAAMRTGRPEASKREMGRIPLLPWRAASQKAAVLAPSALRQPMPLITVRRVEETMIDHL